MADNDRIVKAVIQLVIVLFALAVINAIVRMLPGINTTIPGMEYWGISAIISLVISIIMIIFLVRFAFTISPIIQENYPNFPELATIAKDIVFLICLGIAYNAVIALTYGYLYQFAWLVGIAFLLMGLYLVYIIATLFMKNSDKWSEVIVHDVKQVTSTNKVCKSCGYKDNPVSNNFCDKCGKKLE
jgi:hypothetical protein